MDGGGDLRLGLGLTGRCIISRRGQSPRGDGEGKGGLYFFAGPDVNPGLPVEVDDLSSRKRSRSARGEILVLPSLGQTGIGFMNDGMAAPDGGSGVASGRFDKWPTSICSGTTNTGRKGSIL